MQIGADSLWAQLQHLNLDGQLTLFEPQSSTRHQRQDYSRGSRLMTNTEEFVCSICEVFVIEKQGVLLKNCRHNFCRPCLLKRIEASKTFDVTCPMIIIKCDKEIRDEELQALMTSNAYQKFIEDREQFLIGLIDEHQRNTITFPALLDLDNNDYVENQQHFNCGICMTETAPGDGLLLKECAHEFCKPCLAQTIEHSDEMVVQCPFVADAGARCDGFLQDLELRSLVPDEVYTERLAKSLAQAEATIKDSFHCKTPDCFGWAEAGSGVVNFVCPICNRTNCIKCKAIHEGKSCTEYFYEINADARKARDNNLTEAQVQQLISSRLAMLCPGCGAVIQKTAGCNHMTCSRCRMNFNWVGV